MNKTPRNFGSIIPELKEFIHTYGCRLGIKDKPHYVLVGQYNSSTVGPVIGILAATKIKFYAYILRREINKNGICKIETTEYFPGESTFSIREYKQKVLEKLSRQKEAE